MVLSMSLGLFYCPTDNKSKICLITYFKSKTTKSHKSRSRLCLLHNVCIHIKQSRWRVWSNPQPLVLTQAIVMQTSHVCALFAFKTIFLMFFYSFRFINARRRIVQPMIDQSNRAGKWIFFWCMLLCFLYKAQNFLNSIRWVFRCYYIGCLCVFL